ncbi:Hsp33 family molecular chaperone HslO [Lysobacter sp. A378]
MADSDRLTRFLINQAGVRGVRVHLQDTWQHIRDRMSDANAQAPAAIEMLGEATAAAALFTGHAKVEGRLSVQLSSSSALWTLFVECTSAGTLRGVVQLADPGHDPAGNTVSRNLRELGDGAVLAITIENPSSTGREPMRYQGLVALQADSLADAFEDYFRQSEQLPTRLLLASDGERAAGLMLQKLPGDDGDQDGWTRTTALFDTLSVDELLDLPAQDLLTRLFHEDGVQLLGDKPLSFACSCSTERVEAMLVSLGEQEALAAAAASDGNAQIRCEFCGQRYSFSETRIRELLAIARAEMSPPERLQ